jgi:hypothetical protein
VTRRTSLLTAAFAVLTVVMAAPWSLHPGSRVLVDNPDTHLYMWTLAWDAHAFATDPLRIFDANIFHPDRNTLAWSENLIGSAFFVAPIIWLTGDLVLAMNVAAMLTCMLCGLGAYFLARTLGLGIGAGLVTGIIFAFAPTRFFRMSQLHLTAVQWVPFGLAFLHRYLRDGRAWDLRAAMACLVLQALSGGHGAVFLLVGMTLLAAFHLALRMPIDPAKRVRDIGIPGLLIVLPAVMVWLPYRRAQAEMGLRRTLENWTVSPESFIASPSHLDQWIVSLFAGSDVNANAGAYLFPGILPLLLAIVAVGAARRREVWFYALLTVVSLLMFTPPPISLWPAVYWLPAFNFIRAPSRFMILTTLALAVLAGYGFEHLAARWRQPFREEWRQPFRVALAVATSLLLLAEFSAHPFQGTEYRYELPAIDRWLATLPGPIVVAELPTPNARQSGPFERHQTRAMLHSTAHWHDTIHGYSGIRSPRLDEATMALTRFPDDESVAKLRELGVTHVIIHGDELADHPALRLLRAEADGRAYAVK